MRVSVLIVAAIMCCGMHWRSLPAQAGDNPISTYYREKIARQQQVVDDGAARRAAATAPAAIDEQAEDCRAVAWLVYFAMTTYVFDNERLPGRLDELVSAGLLREVPLNPLSGEPVRILSTADAWSSGDVVLQTAPSDYYSIVGDINNYDLRPLSFELAVYGPEGAMESSRGPLADNPWAVKPRGAIAMYGTHTEKSAQTTLAKIQQKLNGTANAEVRDE